MKTNRIDDTLAAATEALRFAQRYWPFTARTSRMTFAAVAGAGVAVGVGAGLLFAPQSGRELRASLRGASKDLVSLLDSQVQGVMKALGGEAADASESGVQARRGSAEPAHA